MEAMNKHGKHARVETPCSDRGERRTAPKVLVSYVAAKENITPQKRNSGTTLQVVTRSRNHNIYHPNEITPQGISELNIHVSTEDYQANHKFTCFPSTSEIT
jgi:hypothetical protein